jgi:hypothetical protein
MDCPDFGVCNPSVIQPNVRRQATLNRDTDSVVALTPNIKLVVRRSSLVVLALANDNRPTTNDRIPTSLRDFDEQRPDPCLARSSEPAPDDA